MSVAPPMTEANDAIETSNPSELVANPLVSVLMITYNHAEYLAEAIEGVVAQRCDFPFELIIGEDASRDNTLAVALEYQRRYPRIIRVVHSATNVGMNANGRRIFDRARGEFLAYCEGDDYWCRSDKLARQVELIRRDGRIGIVHSDWVRSYFKRGAWQFDARHSVHRRVPQRLLHGDLSATWHLPKILRTCTVLLRRDTVAQLLGSAFASKRYKFGDSVQNAFVALEWEVAYWPAVAAVYRVSPNSALRSGAPARVAFYKSCLQFDTDARAIFADSCRYKEGYRWESAVGLLVWSLRACDAKSARQALRDLASHFGPVRFIVEGWRAIAIRWPTFTRQSRTMPDLPEPASRLAGR